MPSTLPLNRHPPPRNDAAPTGIGACVNESANAPESTLLREAVIYSKRGFSVIPVKNDKRPTVRTWKSAQGIAAKPDDVPGWFGRQHELAGVGIVLGAVSGGVYARDFDDAGAYGRWKAAHPDLAASLPTVRTARGFHVYARWEGVGTTTFDDGELRGEGAYVVAPPSVNAAGHVYTWVVPLPEGEVSNVDPGPAGLARGLDGKSEGRATERTERTEKQRRGEHRDTEDIEDMEDPKAIARGLQSARVQIEDAIRRTQPPEGGKRNYHVFKLARALKAIPGVREIPLAKIAALKPIVKEWHRLAAPKVFTKDFGTTWGDFAHAWENVRFPDGEDVLGAALEAAERADPPECSEGYAPAHRLLASLCRELQRGAGDKPFFLSAAKAGECVGADKGMASRWLRARVADGVLIMAVKPTQHRATRWRYVASDVHQPDAAANDETG